VHDSALLRACFGAHQLVLVAEARGDDLAAEGGGHVDAHGVADDAQLLVPGLQVGRQRGRVRLHGRQLDRLLALRAQTPAI
jgi:hypothetical protein